MRINVYSQELTSEVAVVGMAARIAEVLPKPKP